MPILKNAASRGGERGFSAVEALVSVVVLAIIVLFAVTMFQTSNKVSRSAHMQGDTQQSARVAIDLITKDLRSLGYDIDLGTGQQGLVHAGPFDVIFNANVNPSQDTGAVPGNPGAIDVGLAPAAVPAGGPLYAPAATFVTGAETIRYTLDSNGDGAIDATDQGDDPEEASPNPNDFVLHKQVYGSLADGTNGGNGEPVAIVRGPVADQDGNLPRPLLQYWLDDDDDDTTPEVLHGDGDGDGQLSQAEIAILTAVPTAQLALVTRSVIVVSTEDGESQGRGDYRTREVLSSVSFRNFIRRSAVIAGIVFQDTDTDGEYDAPDEVGIPNVTVRLSSGDAVLTASDGQYVFETSPGVYTVTELDPAGYVSTTSNTASVTASTGATVVQNFGDRPGAGVAYIEGTVYHDRNENRSMEGGEEGIENVVVTLHTGAVDTTDARGQYDFQVAVGTYTVVETDSTGWGSTTPNVVEVILSLNGQREVVNFGDIPVGASGTIRGMVYLDLDADGVKDTGETGIADVPIVVSDRDSTVTDGSGNYSLTVPSGNNYVREYDLAGYSSSTPNLVTGIVVLPDSTYVVDFGDVYLGSIGFTVVAIGTTDRALSIASVDLKEDTKSDPDIILGTQLSASNNLHVWHNKRVNSGTPITGLFNAAPSFSRNAGGPIPTLQLTDINNDSTMDLVTGLDLTAANNIKLWQTITSGASKGMYPATPDFSYQTFSGRTVRSLGMIYWPGWSNRIYLVGTKVSTGVGAVEVWLDMGSGSLTHAWSYDLTADANGSLGEIAGIATGDFNGDGYTDIAVGQDDGAYQGRLTIFEADPNFTFSWVASANILPTTGAVASLSAVNMAEDNQNDTDLVVGTSKALGTGVVELWLNDGGKFGTSDGAGGFVVSDWVDSGGEVLSMSTTKLDIDVFPDVVVGLRTASYSGRLDVYRGIGYLPSTGTAWSSTSTGELVALSVNDFNIDGKKDVAAGTRTAATTGQLIVFFGQ